MTTAPTIADPLDVALDQATGVSVEAWAKLGAQRNCQAWRIPERDADGLVVGWVRRFDDGRRPMAESGSKRGLSMAWPLPTDAGKTPTDPILIVEGASDAASGIELGFVTIGRPSATGGRAHLRHLLRGRHVVIVGENDSGAGRTGAEKIAADLHNVVASLKLIYPPECAKDLREWYTAPVGCSYDEVAQLISQATEWQPATAKTEAKPSSRLISVCMADVEPETIKWLWSHRFPLSKLSILAGMQGQGKSFVTLDMAARISTGTPWPDERDQSIEVVGSTIILSLEDGLGDTIRPRLNAAGADATKIHAIPGVREVDDEGERTFSVTRDVFMLEELIDELGDVRLVVVDPLTGYLGGHTDVHRDNEVRAALSPLGDLATRTGVSIIGVMHLRKSPSDQAMFRVLGSVAFTAYARACWLIGEDDEEPGSKLMLPVKLNVAKAAPGLRFEIVEPGRVAWSDQPVDATAEDVFAGRTEHPDEAGPKVVAAAEWLQQALANGSQRASDLKKQAGENCISPRTLDRAKARLRVVASNEGMIGGAWSWALPEPKPALRGNQP